MLVVIAESQQRIRVESEDLPEDEQRDVATNLEMPEGINFRVWPRVSEPQVRSDIAEPIHYFKLFFTI